MAKEDSSNIDRRQSSAHGQRRPSVLPNASDRRASVLHRSNDRRMSTALPNTTGRRSSVLHKVNDHSAFRRSSSMERKRKYASDPSNPDRPGSSSAKKYRPSFSRQRPRRAVLSKTVYIPVIVVGLIIAIGAGFGIGFAVYPNLFNSYTASIQDQLTINPIDIQSDDSEEILVRVTTDEPTTTPIIVSGIDSRSCGSSAMARAVSSRSRRATENNFDNAIRSRSKRIVNGVEASLINFPWQISLWSDGGHTCGGSIISSHWILTAAHCLQPNNDPKNWTLHAGANLQYEMAGGQSQALRFSVLVIHPSFSTSTFENDIALMRTESPLRMTEMVAPVCLPTSDAEVEPGNSCFISGWGAKKEGGSATDSLLNATVEIIDGFVCNGDEWLGGLVADSMMICAGKESGEVDACQGDSGGPLSCQREDGRFVVSGIVSWGIGCGTYRMPGVYTRTSHYRNWIMESIQIADLNYP